VFVSTRYTHDKVAHNYFIYLLYFMTILKQASAWLVEVRHVTTILEAYTAPKIRIYAWTDIYGKPKM